MCDKLVKSMMENYCVRLSSKATLMASPFLAPISMVHTDSMELLESQIESYAGTAEGTGTCGISFDNDQEDVFITTATSLRGLGVDVEWLEGLLLDSPGTVALLLHCFLFRVRAADEEILLNNMSFTLSPAMSAIDAGMSMEEEAGGGCTVIDTDTMAEIAGCSRMITELVLQKKIISVKDILKQQKKSNRKSRHPAPVIGIDSDRGNGCPIVPSNANDLNTSIFTSGESGKERAINARRALRHIMKVG